MPVRRRSAPSVADVAVLAAAIDQDAQQSAEHQAQRDRRLALSREDFDGDRVRSALAWLDAMTIESADLRELHERAAAAARAIGLGVTLLGLLLGWIAALGVFYYDGSGRVNVVAVLAVFVLLPALLLLPFLLALLPSPAVAWLPGASAARALFRGLSPGQLGHFVRRLLPAASRDAWTRVGALLARHRALYSGVQTWALVRWSQAFAIGYQLAAVITVGGLVVFTDLAFGWSTTLTSGRHETDAQQVHAFTSALAVPWSWAIDAAEPSLALIRESRYFRAVDGRLSLEQAARLGGWWPFVIMAMITYGLLPRLIAFAVATVQLQSRAATAIALTPGLSAILHRLHRARVATTAVTPEEGPPAAPAGHSPAAAPGPAVERVSRVINWSGVPVADAHLAARFGGVPVDHAGGSATLESDRAVAARLAETNGGDLAIVVKSWEPPLLEFADFARSLRRTLGPGRQIVVHPLGIAAAAIAGATPAQVAVWRKTLAALGDPWLRVADLPPEEPA